jgi:hypothetical protein
VVGTPDIDLEIPADNGFAYSNSDCKIVRWPEWQHLGAPNSPFAAEVHSECSPAYPVVFDPELWAAQRIVQLHPVCLYIRTFLIDIRSVRNKFCAKDGSEVAEDTTFDVYVEINGEQQDKVQQDKEQQDKVRFAT